MEINIIDMLSANILHFSIFAIVISIIVIGVSLAPEKSRFILVPLVLMGSYVFLAWYTQYLSDEVKSEMLKKMRSGKENYDQESESLYSVKPNIEQNNKGTCSVCSIGVNGGDNVLLPIMDPKFNLREVAKNLILLEDHLFHKGKRCPDCCVKHALMIDGLLDEAKTLDKQGQYTNIIEDVSVKCKESLNGLENTIKNGQLTDSNTCVDIAQQLRKIRKILTSAMIESKI